MFDEFLQELKRWIKDELEYHCDSDPEYLAVLRVRERINQLEEELRVDLRD